MLQNGIAWQVSLSQCRPAAEYDPSEQPLQALAAVAPVDSSDGVGELEREERCWVFKCQDVTSRIERADAQGAITHANTYTHFHNAHRRTTIRYPLLIVELFSHIPLEVSYVPAAHAAVHDEAPDAVVRSPQPPMKLNPVSITVLSFLSRPIRRASV